MPEQNDDGSLRELRDLSAAEYEQTYATGSGGHEVPQEVLDRIAADVEQAMNAE